MDFPRDAFQDFIGLLRGKPVSKLKLFQDSKAILQFFGDMASGMPEGAQAALGGETMTADQLFSGYPHPAAAQIGMSKEQLAQELEQYAHKHESTEVPEGAAAGIFGGGRVIGALMPLITQVIQIVIPLLLKGGNTGPSGGTNPQQSQQQG